MRAHVISALAVMSVALSFPHAAHALTPLEAQTLPTAELAKQVLGELGVNVLEVDRPVRWGSDIGGHDPLTESAPVRSLTFYSKAFAVGRYGLCATSVVEVQFDQGGKVSNFSASRRYGVQGQLANKTADVRNFQSIYDEQNKICQSAISTRSYFRAANSEGAEFAVRSMEYVGNQIRAKNLTAFRFAYLNGLMDSGERYLSRIDASRIYSVNFYDCGRSNGIFAPPVKEHSRCYYFELNDSPVANDSILMETEKDTADPVVVSVQAAFDYMKRF